MGKSVYSLVLMDDIVAAVDRLAYQEGTSRSNMVNRILAEYVQMDTPENRIRTIFDAVNAVLGTQSALQPMMATGDAVVAMRSALQYKYNPSVRYVVELYTAGDALGEMRAALRTQNPTLLLYLGQFYRLWDKLEDAYLPGPRRESSVAGGRYTRRLLCPQNCTEEQAGEAIAAYVRLFDACLKEFFEHLDEAERTVAAVQRVYTQNLDALTAQL